MRTHLYTETQTNQHKHSTVIMCHYHSLSPSPDDSLLLPTQRWKMIRLHSCLARGNDVILAPCLRETHTFLLFESLCSYENNISVGLPLWQRHFGPDITHSVMHSNTFNTPQPQPDKCIFIYYRLTVFQHFFFFFFFSFVFFVALSRVLPRKFAHVLYRYIKLAFLLTVYVFRSHS